MTLQQYANSKVRAGQFPGTSIEPGTFGGFWVVDDEFRTLDRAYFNNREAAEKARSSAISKAVGRFA